MSMSKTLFPGLASLPICIPRYYGGVVLVGVGALTTNLYFASRVMKARKEHKVEYPLMYHPTNNAFNCIQRGHQNYLESLPFFLMTLFVGGLRYPRAMAVCGSMYLIGRVLYFRGYSTGDPEKRKQGALPMLAFLPMILGTMVYGVQHLVASIRCNACGLRT